MTLETGRRIEAAFFALPKDRRCRAAFVRALELAGHRFVYCENSNHRAAFRMYDDDGTEFKEVEK